MRCKKKIGGAFWGNLGPTWTRARLSTLNASPVPSVQDPRVSDERTRRGGKGKKEGKRMSKGLHVFGGAEVRGDAFRISTRSGSEGKGRKSAARVTMFPFQLCAQCTKMEILVLGCFAIASAAQGVAGLFDSCVHGGATYKEGENFTANDTVIKTEGPHQCVQCRCLRGLVLCEIENCPSADCETPLRTPQFCCLRCPGTLHEKEETTDFLSGKTGSDLILKQNAEGDCVSNGMSFKNGSVWQPVIGPFGVMACVQCRCHDGNIICARVECGSPGCSHPRRELGQCCPVCRTSELNEGKAFCLPKSSELFVFKTANVRNNSDRIEYAFLENTWEHNDVKIHTWNLRAKSLDDLLNVSVMSRKDFPKRSFQILGSASRRRIQKYSRREKKLKKNCSTKCFLKIGRLEHTLLDFAVNSRVKCAEDEVDVDDI